MANVIVNGDTYNNVEELEVDKVGGGTQVFELPKNLQNKSVTITQNETVTYTADSGYDGLASLEVTTNVSGGGSGNPEGAILGGELNTVTPATAIKFNQNSTSLDFTGIDTSDITIMRNMFNNFGLLTNLDISNFDTDSVTDMHSMFFGCELLTELDVSSFDTSNVTDMCGMFRKCRALTNLNVSNFNTSNVTTMEYMFGEMSITSLDLSNFNTSNVTTMRNMFYGCSSLQTLDIRNFDFTNVTNFARMFSSVSSSCVITVKDQDVKDFLINTAGTTNLYLIDPNTQIVIASE